MMKAIPQEAHTAEHKPLCEWTFKDIEILPLDQQKEWKIACQNELDILKKHNVLEIVDLPRGRKVISNR
jgi:hypothetical protein